MVVMEGWIELPKFSEGYIRGIRSFLRNAFSRYFVGDEITCPCKNFDNHRWHCEDVIFDHLIYSGPSPLLVIWICEISNTENINMEFDEGVYFGDNLGEMLHRMHNCQDKGRGSGKPNKTARNFYRLIEDEKQPLYQEAFPEAHIPLSFKDAENVIKDLGLDYQKIHGRPNNYMLFRGENEKEEVCKACNASRWIVVGNKDTSDDIPEQLMHKVPAKPLIAELKDLWDKGIETYDALAEENFNLRASILWTIIDFLGKFLKTNHMLRFNKKRFNGEIEMGMSPSILLGLEVEELLTGCQNQFGPAKHKRKGMKKKREN
ncbi:uncharacterized protein LOC141689234 [Apium graveolens]|uniref:uncharacterized protein LOC141689234 n=1 Tax=Apium graveolens TaxID=4045 RepID=UPI003D79853A